MNYGYAVLNDGTQIAYSQILDDGCVRVSVERPVDSGFDSARCMLPSMEWSNIEGFGYDDMNYLEGFVRRNAPLILRLAREVSKEYA